ncbi:hypothetical protein CRYUN_Cryun05aG0083900 [Craigia yunnanensis]
MDHGYDGVSCVTAGAAAAAAICATSTVDASFCSGFDNDSSPFLGFVSIPGPQYHHNCSLNFEFQPQSLEFLLILETSEAAKFPGDKNERIRSRLQTVTKMEASFFVCIA